ncbi:hypothetical protein [Caballeronia sp. J97]|uniref:hypothetical protein n=1 Tax=Caballeronia sp. J97 TaxID=2805429 RepID=UPI0039F00E53
MLGPEDIRAWQPHLIDQKRSRSTLSVATYSLRFLYNVTLKRDWGIEEIAARGAATSLPAAKPQ